MEILFTLVYAIFSAIATLVWYFFLFVIGMLILIAAVVSILGLMYGVNKRR